MQQSVQCFEYSYLCWYNRDIAGGTTRIVFIVIVLHFMTESKAEFLRFIHGKKCAVLSFRLKN